MGVVATAFGVVEHYGQIAALPDFEGIIGGDNILPCQLVRRAGVERLIAVLYRHGQHIGKTARNIIKIKAVIHIPSAVVFNKEVLYNGHSRLKKKFVFPNDRLAVVEVDFYLARVEQVILNGNGSIHKGKGSSATRSLVKS